MASRVRTPTVIQMETAECGAAALAIVLSYFGRIVPLEEVRVECGVSRDGSRASNILKAARHYGLTAKGYRLEPEQLRKLKFPQIIHWNLNHFVVLEGVGRRAAYINDPASGPRKVAWEEFDQSFSGVAIALEKGPDFKPGGRNRGITAGLRRRAAGVVPGVTLAVLAGLFLVVPGLVVPVCAKIFIDEILIRGMSDWVVPLLVGLGLTTLVQAGLTWLQTHYLIRLGTKLSLRESSRFFWHILRLPVDFFNQRYGGEIGSRVAINDRVAVIVSQQLARSVINVFLVVFYAALMLAFSVPLTLVAIGMSMINLLALRALTRIRTDRSQRMQVESGKLVGVAMGGLQSIETLKAAGRESDFFCRWSGCQAKVINAQQELAQLTTVFDKLPGLLTSLNSAILIVAGGLLIMDGKMTVGTLVAFQSLVPNLMGPFGQLVQMAGTIQELHGDMNRLDDVLGYPLDPSAARAETALLDFPPHQIKLSGGLELADVSFGYSRLEPPLIQDFALTLQPGQRVALVGASGSGKSTVAKLVTGQYPPWGGAITFDGRPAGQVPRRIFTNSVALVDQDIFLFEGSIRDNLTLWDATVPQEDVVAAARDAGIHDDISARPGGYDARVEEMGANFSGGQRQRLEIARALVNNPSILVLDEATSALDPMTEKRIDENLRRRGCSCLIVAHRLSTIRDCDEIIVMQAGRIVQRGTHEDMKRVEGPYARLIQGA